jgi:PAS domain S-box-containing protein
MEKNNEISDHLLGQNLIPQGLLERILENCAATAIIFNEHGKILYFNKRLQDLCGFSEDLILNSSFTDLFPHIGDFNTIINTIRNEVIHPLLPCDYYFSEIKRGKIRGSIIPFLHEGEFKYAIGLFHDIKDIDLLEVKLSEHDSILREIENLSNIGQWEINLKTGSFIWSEGMYRIFKIPFGSISRQSEFFNNVHPDDMGKTHKMIADVTSLKSAQDFEYRIYTPSKELKGIVRILHQAKKLSMNLIRRSLSYYNPRLLPE